LKEWLENAYTMGEDKYPKDCETLLGMMNNFRGSGRDTRAQRINRNKEDGQQFSQANDDNSQIGATMAQEAEGTTKANNTHNCSIVYYVAVRERHWTLRPCVG
jgi:hypothetical protein